MSNLEIEWLDSGREPQCKPDPAHPLGIDLDMSEGDPLHCKATLPYPAPRCGIHVVRCLKCAVSIGVTAAGRPDDPRSIKIKCKGERHVSQA